MTPARDDSGIVEEIRADVMEMRRIAFDIEDVLGKTQGRLTLERKAAHFIKKVLLDHADNLDLQ